ncbi:MAG: ribonuclease HI family protein [Methanogenium sp.]|jgi:ribonuclease HI
MKIYFDGSIRQKNPGGIAGYGWIIKTNEGIALKSGHAIIGSGKNMTNNIAEYTGLLSALTWFVSSKYFDQNEKLYIHGDSALVCNMVSKKWGWEKDEKGVRTGRWTPHKDFPLLKELLNKILEILKNKNVKYVVEWIPREENEDADRISDSSFVK